MTPLHGIEPALVSITLVVTFVELFKSARVEVAGEAAHPTRAAPLPAHHPGGLPRIDRRAPGAGRALRRCKARRWPGTQDQPSMASKRAESVLTYLALILSSSTNRAHRSDTTAAIASLPPRRS